MTPNNRPTGLYQNLTREEMVVSNLTAKGTLYPMEMGRIRKLRMLLKKERADAFILYTHEDGNRNVRYLSGFGGSVGALFITRDKAFIGVDSRYTERARKEASGLTLIPMTRKGGVAGFVNEALSRLPERSVRRIGYEGHHVPVLVLREWEKKIRPKLIPLPNLVGKLRQYKDAGEMRHIRAACRATDKALAVVLPSIRVGMKETDVAFLLDMELRKRGAVESSFPTIVASGPNSAIPHHEASSRRLRAGEPVVIDFGGRFPSGYCSDISRTIFMRGKKPAAEMLRIYNIVLSANRRASRAVRVGMSWKAYDKVARDFITKAGYGDYFTHSVGHSLGLDVHDSYNYKNDPIKADTVLTCEPGIYLLGKGGVRIEDDLLITKKGAERFTHAPYAKPS